MLPCPNSDSHFISVPSFWHIWLLIVNPTFAARKLLIQCLHFYFEALVKYSSIVEESWTPKRLNMYGIYFWSIPNPVSTTWNRMQFFFRFESFLFTGSRESLIHPWLVNFYALSKRFRRTCSRRSLSALTSFGRELETATLKAIWALFIWGSKVLSISSTNCQRWNFSIFSYSSQSLYSYPKS